MGGAVHGVAESLRRNDGREVRRLFVQFAEDVQEERFGVVFEVRVEEEEVFGIGVAAYGVFDVKGHCGSFCGYQYITSVC